MTDKRVMDDLDLESYNALFGAPLNTHGAAVGLPPVHDVRPHIRPGRATAGPGPAGGAGASARVRRWPTHTVSRISPRTQLAG